MMLRGLEATARTLVANGKGILAADETIGTITRRFERLKIESNAESRRTYRELLFTAPEASSFISGAILHDETIRQLGSDGTRLPDLLLDRGIIPGIKVDLGVKRLANTEGEMVAEGLDGLADRLNEYRSFGAQFAKWRAVIRIDERLPTRKCIVANAHALARYAAICQEGGFVPIVEPDVLMDGPHTLDRCAEITGQTLHSVFDELSRQDVSLEGMLLKPNMVVAGTACPTQASITEVAAATLRCLQRHVPAAVPGIVFLSGGQSDLKATAHLNSINLMDGPKPWKLSFSFGRALQDRALATWRGNKAHWIDAQRIFIHRARNNAAATLGKYTPSFENEIRQPSDTFVSTDEDD